MRRCGTMRVNLQRYPFLQNGELFLDLNLLNRISHWFQFQFLFLALVTPIGFIPVNRKRNIVSISSISNLTLKNVIDIIVHFVFFDKIFFRYRSYPWGHINLNQYIIILITLLAFHFHIHFGEIKKFEGILWTHRPRGNSSNTAVPNGLE